MSQWPTTAQIITGPALSCMECGAITPDSNADDFDTCPNCEDDATEVVDVAACPDPESCTSDDHHFRLCVHVAERAR